MKRISQRVGVVLILVLVAFLNSAATTCVSNKIFKVKHVCGKVVDPTGVAIPGVQVELLDSQSNVLRKAATGDSGTFEIQDVLPGQYAIRVQFAGFATAWQPFVLTENKPNPSCKKLMEVHLEVAGRCSSINKPK